MHDLDRSLPDLARTDTTVIIERHPVAGPAQTTSVADTIVGSWYARARPSGLVSVVCLPSMRNDSVLTYQQWQSEVDGEVASSMPGSATRYRLRRSVVFGEHTPADCLVVSTFEFPSPTDAEQWTDLMAAALQSRRPSIDGLLGQYLHIGGATVLNCSAWTHADDHRAFLEASLPGPEWRRVHEYPGMVHGPGSRCRIHAVLRTEQA
ncbi:hypothetical protein [Nocardia cyriacigeorgica]|uniref:hypothetical protein n=1 Tax=Nocardia cyriacigeorgica TaxID=135487 RepID=UPI002453CCC1|nr:hypothetical protein [Nocardia cyriacigeorgica]